MGWHRWITSGWHQVKMGLGSARSPPSTGCGLPGVVYQSSIDRVHAFVVGDDGPGVLYGQLYVSLWDGSKWVWETQGTPN